MTRPQAMIRKIKTKAKKVDRVTKDLPRVNMFAMLQSAGASRCGNFQRKLCLLMAYFLFTTCDFYLLQKMELRPEPSIVNKQLLEAAFNGTLSEKLNSDEKDDPATAKDTKSQEDMEQPSDSQEWTEAQLIQLEKQVRQISKRDRVPALGYHAIQGLREARLNGWSCKTAAKKKGPPKAEKHSPKFWESVAGNGCYAWCLEQHADTILQKWSHHQRNTASSGLLMTA